MVLDTVQTLKHRVHSELSVPVTETPMRPLAGLRILVVEDNAVNQQVAEELLTGQGALVDIAGQGAAGVAAVRAAQSADRLYNVVLMDIQMPVMDGITATRTLRTEFSASQLPIIAMTANAMASDREACLAAGMNDHVGKPFDLDRLTATLLQWTRGSVVAAPIGDSSATSPRLQLSVPVLNQADALKRMGGNGSLLDRASGQFLIDLPQLLQACEAADQAASRDDTLRALHALKGVAAVIGADALAEAARLAEHACRGGSGWDLEKLMTIARQTQQELQQQGSVGPIDAAEQANTSRPALSDTQRDILRRLLPLLERSDMAAFTEVDRLLASGDPNRWSMLDRALQAMDLAEAIKLVKVELRTGLS